MRIPSDLWALDLADAARLLRARAVSPVELTRACLERIERLDPGLNAFITVTAREALDEALSAERELEAGPPRSPMHGIPVALKDLVDVAGVPTTAASAVFEDRVPTRDAEVVRRLRAAGAILLGKLNLHELAYGASSVVGRFGSVRNPWAPDRTAGGSSSGSAVAVATGMCYGAVGTDTGGSIRQPSSFCGVVGLKPTYGRVSMRGVVPLAPSFDHVGPMTRSALDAALMLGAIAGHDPADPTSLDLEVPDYAAALDDVARRVVPYRLGVPRRHFFEDVDPEVAAALDAALAVLARVTADIRDVAVPAETDTTLFRAETWAEHRERVARNPERFQPETLRRLRAGAGIDAGARAESVRRLSALRREAAGLFAAVDLLITPTATVPPFRVDDLGAGSYVGTGADAQGADDLRARELVALRNTRPFNALGLPTVSIPCGFTGDGLPIGLQITGAPGAEATVLQLAHAFQERTDWHRRRPPEDDQDSSKRSQSV
jgi:aspartyl-tRNA(Asn)/glutamyl-tRNA(Gln) amidotransferase subunit A